MRHNILQQGTEPGAFSQDQAAAPRIFVRLNDDEIASLGIAQDGGGLVHQ